MLRGWIVTTTALVTLAAPSLGGQRPAFRSGVDLVVLNVTVTDATREYVVDLEPEDFIVLEDGRRQELTFFSRPRVPLALALLLDTSASMQQTLGTAQEAAAGFVGQLGPEDVATVISFDSRIKIVQDLTSNSRLLELAIRRTVAEGSTSLYEAVYVMLKEFDKRRPETRAASDRRVIMVVFSDGEDTSSLVAFDDVLELATRSDTVIYSIGLDRPQFAAAWNPRDAPFVLRRLARETGGRAFFPRHIDDLAGVYADIREELANQYLLAYEPTSPSNDGRWRHISVQVNRGGLMARTKRGYYNQAAVAGPASRP